MGPPGCTFRLYEGPPNPAGILFENGMRFHGADIMDGPNPNTGPLVRREGEPVQLRLWWSVDHNLDLDYSVNTMLTRSGTVYDTVDGPPAAFYPPSAPLETSRWIPGQYYVELRQLRLPFPAARGRYSINMAVYFWVDVVPVPAPGVDENGLLSIAGLSVQRY